MINTFDPVRLEAFTRLLARPDPRSLPRRTHAYRWEGDPDRRVTRLPAIMMGWLQRRYLDTDVEAPVVCATRTPKHRVRRPNPGLYVLRPTGTV